MDLTKISKVYRIRDWYLNLGISLIGIIAVGKLRPLTSLIVLIQVALVQMYAFSMNDLYDYLEWGEKNTVQKILNSKLSVREIKLLVTIPYLLAFSLGFVVSETWIMILFGILPILYNGRTRLKENYLFSVTINGVGLGGLIFLYPYLALNGNITALPLFFFSIFTLYMMFFEIAHQFEHQKKDNIKSIIDAYGRLEGYNIARGILIASIIVAGSALTIGSQKAIFTTAIVFNLYRLQSTFKNNWNYMETLRQDNSKFYVLYEAIIYVILLIPAVKGF